jgi:CRP-like cAMP-binding protein
MVRRSDIADRLEKVWLFSGCTARERNHIAKLGAVEELPAGTVLMRRGERARDFFVVLQGKVDLAIKGTEPTSRGPGSALGEMALVDGGARSATATAATDVTVYRVGKDQFDKLLHDVPSVAIKLVEAVGIRLRTATRELEQLRTGQGLRPPRVSDTT